MPANTIYVGRPTRWGNPFPTSGDLAALRAVALGFRGNAAGCRAGAVEAYRQWLMASGRWIVFEGGRGVNGIPIKAFACIDAPRPTTKEIQTKLRGRNLACWCALDAPCHADVLLDLADR